MPKRVQQSAIAMAARHECVGNDVRSNDSRLPGTGAWDTRMA